MDRAGIGELMEGLGRSGVAAAQVLALAPGAQKDAALAAAAAAIRARRATILSANARDERRLAAPPGDPRKHSRSTAGSSHRS